MNDSISNEKTMGVNFIKNININEKNTLAKRAIGDFLDFIDDSLKNTDFSWNENIQLQIEQLESETKEYEQIFTQNYANALDLRA
ncbi:MAG: hypothetical protein V2B14_06510 [bacterium]